MKFTTLQNNRRQKGMALILAIGFLAILSILGAIVMQVSRQGLLETADTMPNQRAIYAADRTVEYSMNRDLIVNLAVAGTVILAEEDPDHPDEYLANSGDFVRKSNGSNLAVRHAAVINALSNPADPNNPTTIIISGQVTDEGPHALPPHMAAIHGSEFGANLYHVNVKTKSRGAKQPVHVDASIVRLFKLDDDQIFRTSGGG